MAHGSLQIFLFFFLCWRRRRLEHGEQSQLCKLPCSHLHVTVSWRANLLSVFTVSRCNLTRICHRICLPSRSGLLWLQQLEQPWLPCLLLKRHAWLAPPPAGEGHSSLRPSLQPEEMKKDWSSTRSIRCTLVGDPCLYYLDSSLDGRVRCEEPVLQNAAVPLTRSWIAIAKRVCSQTLSPSFVPWALVAVAVGKAVYPEAVDFVPEVFTAVGIAIPAINQALIHGTSLQFDNKEAGGWSH